MINFILLLILHLIGDFYLQTDKVAKCKGAQISSECNRCKQTKKCTADTKFKLGYIIIHSLIYALPFLVLLFVANFATVAKYGETLSEDYLSSVKDKKYISPDNVIDVSTAWFRDYTWFVKDAPHVAADYNTGFSKFTFTLLECEAQPTIDTFEEYPQFMKIGKDGNLGNVDTVYELVYGVGIGTIRCQKLKSRHMWFSFLDMQ